MLQRCSAKLHHRGGPIIIPFSDLPMSVAIDGSRSRTEPKCLADAIALTSEARLIVESRHPHRILHSSPALFLLTGAHFHTFHLHALSSLMPVTEEISSEISGEISTSFVNYMTDRSTRTSFLVFVSCE